MHRLHGGPNRTEGMSSGSGPGGNPGPPTGSGGNAAGSGGNPGGANNVPLDLSVFVYSGEEYEKFVHAITSWMSNITCVILYSIRYLCGFCCVFFKIRQ